MDWSEDNATEQRLTALEHACRSTVGDRLRSVTVDSPEWNGTVYRRSDLQAGVDESQRLSSATRKSSISGDVDDPGREAVTGDGTVLADGGRAVEEFGDGYVAYFQHGETRIVATTGGIKMDRVIELSAVVRGVFSQ
ncbi:MAG: hypothetical protein V5A38_04445 [Halolamina sp.]|uniref:DUF7522 family protein n=1 Tax=Halolamina sp. TaxID=1940283 RepID=UPI002FC27571